MIRTLWLFLFITNTLCFQNQRKYDLPTIPIEIGSPPQLLYPVLTLQSPYNSFLDNFANDGGTCDETTTPSCIGYSYTASDTSKTDETGIVKDRIVTRFGNHLTRGNLNIMIKESNKASNSYFSISPPNTFVYFQKVPNFSKTLQMTKIRNDGTYYNSVGLCLGTPNFTGPISFGGVYEKLIKGNSISNFQSVNFYGGDERYKTYKHEMKKKGRSYYLMASLNIFEIDFNSSNSNSSEKIINLLKEEDLRVSFRDTNYFHFPNNILNNILKIYEDPKRDENGEYIVDCESYKSLTGNITFNFNDTKKLIIPRNDFMIHPYKNDTNICSLPIASTDEIDDFLPLYDNEVVIGFYVAHWFYIVYNYDNWPGSFSWAELDHGHENESFNSNDFKLFTESWFVRFILWPILYIICLLAIFLVALSFGVGILCVCGPYLIKRDTSGEFEADINLNNF